MAEILRGFQMRNMVYNLHNAHFMSLTEVHQSVNRTPVIENIDPMRGWLRSAKTPRPSISRS